MTKCPICKGKKHLQWGSAESDSIRSEPCPCCLGTGEDTGAAETVRYLRQCEAKLIGKPWPAPGETLDMLTGEVLG